MKLNKDDVLEIAEQFFADNAYVYAPVADEKGMRDSWRQMANAAIDAAEAFVEVWNERESKS
jgi:hypothetical protein